MADPTKNYHALDIKIEEIRKSIESRLDLLRALLWTVFGVMGTLIALVGGVQWQLSGLREEFRVLDTKLTRVEGDVRDTRADAKEIRTDVKAGRSDDGQIKSALARIEARQMQGVVREQVTTVSPDEAQIIRALLKLGPVSAEPGKIQVGDKDFFSAKELPDVIVAKLPSLKGVRFVVDANYAIALVDPTGRVFQII